MVVVPPLHNRPRETPPVISLCPVIGDGMFPHLALSVALSETRGVAEPREITSSSPFHVFFALLVPLVVISRGLLALGFRGGSHLCTLHTHSLAP